MNLDPVVITASAKFPAPRVIFVTDDGSQIGETCFSFKTAECSLRAMLQNPADRRKFNLSEQGVEGRMDYIRSLATKFSLPHMPCLHDEVRKSIPRQLCLQDKRANAFDATIHSLLVLEQPVATQPCIMNIVKHNDGYPQAIFFGKHLPHGVGQMFVKSTQMIHFLACCGATRQECSSLRMHEFVLIHLGFVLNEFKNLPTHPMPELHEDDAQVLALTSRRFGIDMGTLFAEFVPPRG